MKYNSLGVIGGMGPKATSLFFEKVIENTAADKDQDHINMVILNHTSLPDRTEVILNGNAECFLKPIKKDLMLLEKAEVSNIAIPCNTSHYFYNEIQSMTSINVINMIEETIKEVYDKFGVNSKVALLATNGTVQSGIYEQQCNKYKIDMLKPNPTMQQQVMDIIYKDIKGNMNLDASKLEAIIKELVYEKGCHCVILACTELSCITHNLSYDIVDYWIDAMDVLVEKSIEHSTISIESTK
jgi:aspartate racemase